MKKVVLSEIDIVSGTIDCPKGFEIDREKIKNDIITSFINKDTISKNEKISLILIIKCLFRNLYNGIEII